ncbi:hypothetical protein MSPP1_001150 [Malassezia sp. CBS 17886]|nr:hypothetical protein MSPP1_001150 [Malassezia sp. CBS 17886]
MAPHRDLFLDTREVSSPEIDTDVSRTSSTSTKGSIDVASHLACTADSSDDVGSALACASMALPVDVRASSPGEDGATPPEGALPTPPDALFPGPPEAPLATPLATPPEAPLATPPEARGAASSLGDRATTPEKEQAAPAEGDDATTPRWDDAAAPAWMHPDAVSPRQLTMSPTQAHTCAPALQAASPKLDTAPTFSQEDAAHSAASDASAANDGGTTAEAEAHLDAVSAPYAARAREKSVHSILELLETERNYTDDLDMLVNVFFIQLRVLPYFAEHPHHLDTVVRNGHQLFELHRDLTARLDAAVTAHSLHGAARVDEAVADVADAFVMFAPRFALYRDYCARHREALAIVDALELRQTEWDTFRVRCMEAARKHQWRKRACEPVAPEAPAPTAVQHESMRQRLLFRDFFVKPIQRVCLYPLMLQTLRKHAPAAVHGRMTAAIEQMRQITHDVDEASKQRASALLTEMIASRIDFGGAVTPSFLASLGECRMAGNLDVLYHHPTVAPLTVPLPIKYYGCMLYDDFFLVVKVRKAHSYTCRFWFPLCDAALSSSDSRDAYLPNAFRLTVRGHYFEFIAATAKERGLWLDALNAARARGPRRTWAQHGASLPFPCNLVAAPTHAAPDTAPGTNESRPALPPADAGPEDPLAVLVRSRSGPDAARGRSSQSLQNPGEILLRHKSPPRRAALDRGMVFSDACISARSSFGSERVRPHTSVVPSSLSSTVGAIVNFGRHPGSETLALRLPHADTGEADLGAAYGDERARVARPRPTVDTSFAAYTPHGALEALGPLSPMESLVDTAPSSPQRVRMQPFKFPMEHSSAPAVDTAAHDGPGSRFRRRLRGAYSRRSSMQQELFDASQAHELAAALEALPTASNAPTSPTSSAAPVNEMGQFLRANGSTTALDADDAQRPRSNSVLGNAKTWLRTPSRRSSLSEDVPLDDAAGDRTATLKRSSSLNWSALRARNWSSTSLKSLSFRRSVDLSRRPSPFPSFADPGSPVLGPAHVPTNPVRATIPDWEDDASVRSAAISPSTSAVDSAPTSRPPSPRRRKFAQRFLQRNRLSPMATMPHSQTDMG